MTKPFTLPNFEGPLQLLIYLIQKQEIDVCEIQLKSLTTQFIESNNAAIDVEFGADFLSYVSWLILFKSRQLLPELDPQDEEDSSMQVDLMQYLLDYCRFKEVALSLSQKEDRARDFFSRGISFSPKRQGNVLEEVRLEDLAHVLQKLINQAADVPLPKIFEEEWQVAPKIEWLRNSLKKSSLAFEEIFSSARPKYELIVLFLALLELMKEQSVIVIKESSSESKENSSFRICYNG